MIIPKNYLNNISFTISPLPGLTKRVSGSSISGNIIDINKIIN